MPWLSGLQCGGIRAAQCRTQPTAVSGPSASVQQTADLILKAVSGLLRNRHTLHRFHFGCNTTRHWFLPLAGCHVRTRCIQRSASARERQRSTLSAGARAAAKAHAPLTEPQQGVSNNARDDSAPANGTQSSNEWDTNNVAQPLWYSQQGQLAHGQARLVYQTMHEHLLRHRSGASAYLQGDLERAMSFWQQIMQERLQAIMLVLCKLLLSAAAAAQHLERLSIAASVQVAGDESLLQTIFSVPVCSKDGMRLARLATLKVRPLAM